MTEYAVALKYEMQRHSKMSHITFFKMEHVYLCAVINCALTTTIMSLNNSFWPLYHARPIYDSSSVYAW